MPAYQYKARRADGTAVTGQLEAVGRQEALLGIERQGLFPVDLQEAAENRTSQGNAAPPTWRRGRVSAKALETFTRQLASLLAAGVPLAQALQLLAHEATRMTEREQWRAVYSDVVDGAALAQAMSRHPRVFPAVYAAMVRAGETGGFLDLVLRQIADFQNRDRDLRAKVQGALIYPAILAVLAVSVLVFLMIFFIPRFEAIFGDFGAALPPLTRAVVDISLTLRRYGLIILLLVVSGLLLLRHALDTLEGRRRLERQTLRLPIVGNLSARFAMTRFCRMLGTLAQAGVPLIHALRVARESLGNTMLADAVDTAIDRVQHGDRLGASLGACPHLFPASVVAMVTVAEQTGRLDAELIRIADDTENDLDRRLRAAVSLAEPALLFVMAAFVGTIVMAMVLPIFAIQDYIR